ncbi:MAG: hypothetical protein WBP98_13120 [Candidatus Sulfotelmatobacter sp.]
MPFLTGKRGSPTAFTPDLIYAGIGPAERAQGKGWHRLAQQGTAASRTAKTSTVAELARFFPEATPVRIPVQFTRSRNASNENRPSAAPVEESTVIEFGTSREVLFACTTPLEFADVLRLRNSDGSLDTEAWVVAVQYHPGTTIVAARFLTSVPNWIVKP